MNYMQAYDYYPRWDRKEMTCQGHADVVIVLQQNWDFM